MPCTTLLVGKNATYDGSTMMARNEDSGAGSFTPKKFITVNPEDQPRHYRSVLSAFEIELTETPLRYTAMPNAQADEGIWGEAGINELNVAMSETETITSNPPRPWRRSACKRWHWRRGHAHLGPALYPQCPGRCQTAGRPHHALWDL